MRCKPGELALIFRMPVGATKGQENVGIILTVVAVDAEGDWSFKDASRPVVIPSLGAFQATHSDAHPKFWLTVPDNCLLPIRWPDGEQPLTAAQWRQANEEATA